MKAKTMIYRGLLLASLVVVLMGRAAAQGSDFDVCNEPMAVLPGGVSGLSIVDSQLFCHGANVLLVAQRSGEHITGFWPDTTIAREVEGVTYVVKHPATGDVYVTRPDKHGDSYLYTYRKVGNKRAKLKRVKMNDMTVEHPAFSSDGKIMVFTSRDGKLRLGGRDLWYSMWNGEEWGRPRNLGKRVNTKYNDVAPTIYGDFLLYASNGRGSEINGYDIYATRLVSDKTQGDTVGHMLIGVQPVQMLPQPINSIGHDDIDMVVDTVNGCGYWVTDRRGDGPELYMFNGKLDGVYLWGRVLDRRDAALQGVRVVALRDGREVCSAMTDVDGIYSLYLRTDCKYDISFRKDGFFAEQRPVSTTDLDGYALITEMRQDMTLGHLAVGQPLQFNDLFEPGVGLDLGAQGRSVLGPLVRFLNDNPAMSIQATLYCDATTDPQFNAMLTAKRVQTVEQYLRSNVPPTVGITIDNGCGGDDGCLSASGIVRMIVVIKTPLKSVSKKR